MTVHPTDFATDSIPALPQQPNTINNEIINHTNMLSSSKQTNNSKSLSAEDNIDLSLEMRPREPSIILPPPIGFTATECHSDKSICDNGKTVMIPSMTSSSVKHQDKPQKVEQSRKVDVNT